MQWFPVVKNFIAVLNKTHKGCRQFRSKQQNSKHDVRARRKGKKKENFIMIVFSPRFLVGRRDPSV
jgi:hypothetical protein